jgi:hypothetical protein
MPGREYDVTSNAVSIHGEKAIYKYSFETTDIGSMNWSDIHITDKGKACVMLVNGRSVKGTFKGNLRRADKNLPTGTLYVTDVGDQWLKLNADILIHQKPDGEADSDDVHEKLGYPRSYNCIVMTAEVYEKVKASLGRQSMVILHY